MSPLAALAALLIAAQPASPTRVTSPAPQPASTEWVDSRPFTHLFQNLAHDTRALVSVRSAEILGVGGATTAGVHAADRPVADWAGRAGHAPYTRVGDIIGLGATQGGAAVATYIVGKIAHSDEVVHIGGDLIRAQILNGLLTQGLKVAVGRTRPNRSSRSFPSGHTSAAAATAAVLAGHFGWKAAVPLYTLTAFVGFTRVRDHVHYPSDVVFGATLGVLVGQAVTTGHKPRTWTVVPVKTSGGAAIYVVRRK